MIQFIWKNWWRRKERLFLLLIGAFIISAGLTYLIGLSNTNKGTIVENLQQRWSASYDIVVRPDATRSVTEEKKLLEPNYLSGLSGGISLEQYETIKNIEGVEVAAPIAMIGYVQYNVHLGDAELSEPGVYRRVTKSTVDNGLENVTSTHNYYFPLNVWDIANKGPEYGVGAPYQDVEFYSHTLLAGIDPIQEAKLVGLDKAMMELGNSRYFEATDLHSYRESEGLHEFPIIVNRNAYLDKIEDIVFEKLTIPITYENAAEVMEKVKENGGEKYLHTVEGEGIQSFSMTGAEAFQLFVSTMTGVDWVSGEVQSNEEKSPFVQTNNSGIVFKPTPIEYQEIASPYVDRWPYSYQVVPVSNGEDTVGVYRNTESYRQPKVMADNFLDLPRIKPNWIGFYDAVNLTISQDPTNELPMETYRPATAEFVIDSEGSPMNPPKQLKPSDDPYSFLTNPPGMLTTIQAAERLLGENPVSSIRIKVSGVTDLSEESQAILDRVAKEIEEKTGLITDITMGSSPQLALTFVPGLNGEKDVGWIQQPWVNIGSSISIFRETKVGYSALLSSVIAVAIVYAWSSGVVNLLARRKEFAILLSIGWQPSQLTRLLFLESIILGIFVCIVSWTLLGIVYMSSEATIGIPRFVSTGLFGLLIYVLGAIVPIFLARNISPYEAMRHGEISVQASRILQAKGIYRMAFNHFIGKWKRSLLSVLSISLPTALLAVFLYITYRLKGIMYTSLLGEYVALEIGPTHYAAIIIAFIIAVLTTAEIMWQNVSERGEEISILQAIGWRRWSIRKLILAEGVYSGICSAVIGLSIALIMLWGLYGEFPIEGISFLVSTSLIPILIGVIGTILPAERAVRIIPNQGFRGSVTNRKSVEKQVKWGILSASFLLAVAFLYTMVKVIPNIEVSSGNEETGQSYSPTVGETIVREKTPEISINQNAAEEKSKTEEVLYDLEFHTSQTSLDTNWNEFIDYSAVEIESQLPSEDGMRNVAIEFSFEVLDDTLFYQMKLRRHFILRADGESYWPVKATVLEAEDWRDETLLYGKIHAILEFKIPENTEKYGLLFRSNSNGRGYMVYFD